MSGVVSQFGWLFLVVAVVVGVALFPDWVKQYYGQPEEPTLLDAPHAAEQARRVVRAAETECAAVDGQRPAGGGA